ncbi:4,5-DOPA-extradiol-dioxygenase [Sphingomonas nostoxanthinifaciens]|uniref:4,5-DOPA-extradiol-dioxygenase n=1 Tax=Sphingomonas nostoxanthinifaciens TaxID=2872652 RepID=UPI001CC1DC6B|nr:4,5-DOPA dioxygenase extradiol [Sphingomonas nostoxanthinifaciens]UAK25648.1 4,5-DOPA dioxygenase extradiol [Sphingomonas nostoxanthinifaciens]
MIAPALFVGHGSPRDALRETSASKRWAAIAAAIDRPRAVLCISAHWESKGVLVTRGERPRTIHDFYRFPEEFYAIDYPAPGDPALALKIETRLQAFNARADLDSWGLDHGSWTVLRWMYPAADVPVLQLSLDVRRTAGGHYAIGQAIAGLREEGVMILGSGNIVHNLRVPRPRGDEVFLWAGRFDARIGALIEAGDHAALIDYQTLPDAADAVPESEHFLPLLYVLGAARPGERPMLFNRQVLASVSMTGVGFGIPDSAG